MPRKSKGCERCRMRKILCDSTKPECGNCLRSSHKCPGYRVPTRPGHTFVIHDPRIRYVSAGTRPEISSAETCLPMTISCVSQGLDSGYIYQKQFLAIFLSFSLPAQTDSLLMTHLMFLEELSRYDISLPVLQCAVDAMSLVGVGSVYGNEQMIHEARQSYGAAVRLLTLELSPPFDLRRRLEVLASMIVLAICELYSEIAADIKGSGWVSHVDGAEHYMDSVGPLPISSKLALSVFQSQRHSSICKGLVSRRPSLFAKAQWQTSAGRFLRRDPSLALQNIIVHIPGLLNRADKITSSQAGNTLCSEITELRWHLENWIDSFPDIRRSFTIVDGRDMQFFSALCANRTYMTVFNFTSPAASILLQQFWMCCVLLDHTLLLICGSCHLDPFTFAAQSSDEIERVAYVAMTNFCRSVPYCYQPGVGSVARVGSFLLHNVQKFAEMNSYFKELDWILNVRQILEEFPDASAENELTSKWERESYARWRRHHGSMIGFADLARELCPCSLAVTLACTRR